MTPSPNPQEQGAVHPVEGAALPEDRLPTYQEVLDEAVQETFPASDPVATTTAAAHAARPASTPSDGADWQPEPSQEAPRQQVVATFDDEAKARAARDAAVASELPSARLELPAQGTGAEWAARVVIRVEHGGQAEQVRRIVQGHGATQVDVNEAAD